MKILVVGATGTIGAAVSAALAKQHDVVAVSRGSDPSLDLTDIESIRTLYRGIPDLDAVVSTAGDARFGSLRDLEDADFDLGLRSKLMGQVNLVRVGTRHLRPGGSFTLTSGILATQPGPQSSMLSMINAGLEGFARAAALDLEGSFRTNVVSPPLVLETAQKMGWGNSGLPAAEVARAYLQSVTGTDTGRIFIPGDS
jgi:NAD(P)-dependent dehydrogenase (short-subunit alcohol dehydrogenase family)